MGITAKGYYKIRKKIVSKYILIKLKKKILFYEKVVVVFIDFVVLS